MMDDVMESLTWYDSPTPERAGAECSYATDGVYAYRRVADPTGVDYFRAELPFGGGPKWCPWDGEPTQLAAPWERVSARGRPYAAPAQALQLRLTREQRGALDREARRVGLPTSTWAREVLLAAAGAGELGEGARFAAVTGWRDRDKENG